MKKKNFVSQSLFLVLFFSFCVFILSPPNLKLARALPEIDAHEFSSTPLKKSSSGRIYEFKTESGQLPKTGSVVLLKENDKPVMALRVLRTDDKTSEYIAKRVRSYEGVNSLNLKAHYTSFEKVAEVMEKPATKVAASQPVPVQAPPLPITPEVAPEPQASVETPPPATEAKVAPPVTAEPVAQPPVAAATPEPLPQATPEAVATPVPTPEAVAQATPEPSPEPAPETPAEQTAAAAATPAPEALADNKTSEFDKDLDAGSSPGADENTDEEDEYSEIEPEEKVRLDPFENALSFEIGYFNNMSGFNLSGIRQNGFGIAYDHRLSEEVFATGKVPQDSMNYEIGLGYYRAVNIDGNNDVYTIVPLRFELRYELNLTPSFTAALYAGLQYNWLAGSSNVDERINATTLGNLRGIQHTFGAGFVYNLGPQWYLRADLGWDRIMGGLSVKW